MTRALELGELANFTSVNVAGNTVTFDTSLTNDATTVGGNTALTLRTYTDNKAANAYANVFNGGTFTGVVTMQANLTANTVRLNGSMQIDGDLIVSGNTVTMNVSSLAVEDNMIYLNSSSNVANPDIGIAGNYNDGTYRHTGVFRDATDGVWKFFHQYVPEPDASAYIDTSNNTFALANVQANTFLGALSGSLSGNVVGNTANLTTSVTVGSNALTVGTTLYVVANGYTGIGTSTPAFYLDVKGPDTDNTVLARFYANNSNRGSFVIRNGTNTQPTTYIGTLGTAENLALGSNSTTIMTLSNTLRVGVGVTSPTSILHINGNSAYSAATLAEVFDGPNAIKVQSRASGTYLVLGNNIGGLGADISSASSNTTSTSLFLQSYGGGVSIGHTGAPASKLDIFSASDYGHLTLRSNTGNVGIRFDVENPGTTYRNWQLDAQGIAGDTMTFTPSTTGGGTTFSNPAFKVIASGDTGYVRVGNNTAYSNWDRNSLTGNTTEDFYIQAGSGKEIHLRPNNASNAVKITANNSIVFEGAMSGTLTNARNEICIGTTPSWGTTAKTFFTAVGEYGITNTGIILACGYDDGGDVGGMKITDDGVIMWGAGDEDLFRIYNEDNNNLVFQINDAGACFLNGSAVSSDVRLKDDISTISNALNKTLQLRGVYYSMLNEKTGVKDYNIGVIAQEANEVIPEVVKQARSGYYHVAYGNMVGLLIEAIKELNAKVEALEAQR